MKKIVLLIFGVLIAITSLCQVNGNFKSIRLINADSTAGTLNGTVYYGANGFRFREGGTWKTLSTASSLVTASNGLTKTGNNIKIGGPFIDASTTLTFDGTATDPTLMYNCITGGFGGNTITTFNGTSGFTSSTYQSGSTGANADIMLGDGEMRIRNSANASTTYSEWALSANTGNGTSVIRSRNNTQDINISLIPSSAEMIITDSQGKGLTYFADYSATYVTRSLVDRGYVLSAKEYSDGAKQTFNPNGTNAGMNTGSHTADPSSPANGDLWYESTNNLLRARINGATVSLGVGAISGLTTNRIPYASSATSLTDDADFTWDATNNSVTIGGSKLFGGPNNVFLGASTGNFTLSGISNVIIGPGSATQITTGAGNVSIGSSSLSFCETGSRNIAIGSGPLGNLNTGSDNIAIGNQAAGNITSASKGVWIGTQINAQSTTSDGQLSIQNIIFGTGNTASGTTVSSGEIGIGVVPTTGVKFSVNQNTLGNIVSKYSSTSTNDDPTIDVYQNRVTTTDATVTTIHTFTVPASTTVKLKADVVARRTGGSAGTAEDGAGYEFIGTYKNVAGTATLIGAVSATYTAESQAGWDATFTVSGANVLIRVTGAVDNNVTWHLSKLESEFVSQ